jgi:integrase
MGLRPYKELLPMRTEHFDLENRLVRIPESKTQSGEGGMPMTDRAWFAFKQQIQDSCGSEYVFPSTRSGGRKPHITNRRKAWVATLKRAGVPYFSIYELRHTFATRLSAGGVADHFVAQMLRQSDAGGV